MSVNSMTLLIINYAFIRLSVFAVQTSFGLPSIMEMQNGGKVAGVLRKADKGDIPLIGGNKIACKGL